MRFDVYVVPRSRRAGPDGRYNGLPRLRVKSPPAEGRANDEAERILSEVVGARVRLHGGARSRRKTFEVDIQRQLLETRLQQAFGA